MPTTTNLALPYPAPAAAPDVPGDIYALAKGIDDRAGWTNYSPTLYNVTPGTSGFALARWKSISGPTLRVQFYLLLGSTFSITGGIRFSLPFPVDTNSSNYFSTHNMNRVQMYLAGSSPRYHLGDAAPYDNQIATIQYIAGANGDPTDVNASNLWSWTQSSWIKCVYDYERG